MGKIKVDWGRKLSSRKLWALVAALVISICVIFHVDAETTAQIAAILTAFGSVVVYILAEQAVDVAREKSNKTVTSITQEYKENEVK